MKYLVKILITTLLIGATYSNYKVFKTSEFQSNIMYDFNNGSFVVPLEYIKSNSGNYPNVTITAIPIKYLQARYFEEIDSIEIAKRLYFESMSEKINPYLKAAEAELADLYFNQKKYDSAYFFAKQAFDILPNANPHRTVYFKTLKQRGDTIALENAFNRIKKYQNNSHWLNYFYSRYDLVGPGDKQILSLIEEYREKFNLQNDTGVDVLEKVMLQGGSKVERSVSVSLEATELFKEKKYIEAADLFVVAAQIDETEYTFYENAGIAYNLAGDYEKATINFDKVIYELNQRNGKAEFYKGVMLIKLESISKGCDYLKKAVELGYSGRGSVDVYNNYCN